MWGERIRGVVAVIVVAVAIGVAFVVIDSSNEPETVTDSSASTTSASTTVAPTTTVDGAGEFDRLCELTVELYENLIGSSPLIPGFETLALQEFYTEAATLNLGVLTPEYQAAARHYESYNRIGGPYDYDSERVLSESEDPDRWVTLVTRPAVGVDDSRAHVLFVCDVDLPEAPSEDIEDIEEILEDIKDEED